MTARSVAEIRADLADCDRDGLPWPSAARRLLADIEPLLARLEAVRALADDADQIGNPYGFGRVLSSDLRAALSVAPQPQPAPCSTCGAPMDTPGCSKRPGDDRTRALAGFHTIDGPGPVCDTAPEQSR